MGWFNSPAQCNKHCQAKEFIISITLQAGLSLGAGTLAPCQEPRAPKAVIAATDDGSIDQTFIALGDELLSQLELT